MAWWDPRWYDIIIEGEKSLLKQAIADGYDGIYMDWVEVYDDPDVVAVAAAQGIDPARAMVDFISRLRTVARTLDPDFLVVAQNAPFLIDEDSRYTSVIDGVAFEDTWFGGTGDAQWGDPQGGDIPNEDTEEYGTVGRIKQYKKYLAKGIPVFTCDYCRNRDHAADVYEKARAHGFVPLVTQVALSEMTTTPPPWLNAWDPLSFSQIHILTSLSPAIQVASGEQAKIYGSSEKNTVTIEAGGTAHLLHMPGKNTVVFHTGPQGFVVFRSGAYLILERRSDNTGVKMPVTTAAQTITFTDGSQLTAQIIGNTVRVGNQTITLTPVALESGSSPPLSDTDHFPSGFYPNTGQRPRLWLTAERRQAIETARQQNLPDWQAFKQLCDSMVDQDTDNDPWDLGWLPQNYTAPLALLWQLTGDHRYADRAVELMDSISLDLSDSGPYGGDPDHALWHYMGLTYDWLYDRLTTEQRQAWQVRLKQVSDRLWEAYNESNLFHDTDRNLLTAMYHLTLGAALYGDDTAGAVTLLDRAWQGWSKGYGAARPNGELLERCLGGVWPTGMQYLPATDGMGIAGFQMTLQTACQYDINTQQPVIAPFWGNVIRSLVHLTDPSREHIAPTGSWENPTTILEQPWLRRLVILAAFFAKRAGDGDMADLARGYLHAVGLDQVDINDPFSCLMFGDPQAPAVSPYTGPAGKRLPLVRLAKEPDFLFFRDSWKTTANRGIFRGDGTLPVDHQTPDHGHFSLWRKGVCLTNGARNYMSLCNGNFFNTLSIENHYTFDGTSCGGTALLDGETPARISRYRTQKDPVQFAYAMMNGDGQWNPNPDNPDFEGEGIWSNVTTYRRHFFWSGDHVVILDRLRTKIPGFAKYRLRALTEPTVTGNVVAQLSQNGQQKLMQKTLTPFHVTIEKKDESVLFSQIDENDLNSSEKAWQTVISMAPATRHNILNVIRTGPADMNDFGRLDHLAGGDFTGVRMENWVITFAEEEVLRSGTTYQVVQAQGNTHHLVADLVPGTWHVRVNGQFRSDVTVSPEDNTAFFTTQTTGDLSIELIKE